MIGDPGAKRRAWIDAIHYKIKIEGRYENKAVYTVLGLNLDGKKWTMPTQNWSLPLSQLSMYFEGRLDEVLDI
jgi:transposase-like protein